MLRWFILHRSVSLLVSLAVLAGCSTVSTPDPVGPTPTVTRYVRDFTFRKIVGSSVTLDYRTLNIKADGDTTVTPGSTYRYTIVDTAFVRPDGKRCIAVQRETMDDGVVRLTDTTFQWTDDRELITFERLLDSIGRRRLVEPVRVGTTFLLRSNLGSVETNRYSIVGVDVPVQTVLGKMSAVHVRMSSSTTDAVGTSTFTDEQWLVPDMHIVLQRQRRVFRPTDGSTPTESIFEFTLTTRSW